MSWRTVAARVLGFWRRKDPLQNSLREEIEAHIQLQTEENLERGMSPEAARHAALVEFGNPALAREDSAAQWTIRGIESFVQDLKHGLVQLRKSPLVSAAAILSLALGIGATTAMFNFVEHRSVSRIYKGADQIVAINVSDKQRPTLVSWPTLRDWSSATQSFSALGGYYSGIAAVQTPSSAEMRTVAIVTPGLLDALGVKPLLGRIFKQQDAHRCDVCPVVLSYETWQSLGAKPDIIGQTVTLTWEPEVVIGVLPEGFVLPSGVAALSYSTVSESFGRQTAYFNAVGRLKPGVGPERAAAELSLLTRQLDQQYPGEYRDLRVDARSLREAAFAPLVTSVVWLSFLAAALLLIIGCANVAALLLAKGASRQTEASIRSALGAKRSRLLRQFLTEGLVVSVIGGAAGIGLAFLMVRIFDRVAPDDPSRFYTSLHGSAIDANVLLFCLAVTLATGLIFHLPPAWRISKANSLAAGRNTPGHEGRLQRLFIALQATVTSVLLVAVGLVGHSLWAVSHVDPGFNEHDILMFTVLPKPAAGNEPVRRAREQVYQTVSAVPGVTQLGFTSIYPLYCWTCVLSEFQLEGATAATGTARLVTVGQNYFDVMGMRLLEGRSFGDNDRADTPAVVVINRRAARLIPGDPLGRSIRLPTRGNRAYTVVGVVSDIKEAFLSAPSDPVIYLPDRQNDAPAIIVGLTRTSGDPTAVAQEIRKRLRIADPSLRLVQIGQLDSWVDRSLAMFQWKLPLVLLAPFAATALLICVVALYAVVAFSVARRRRELGIRVAMGARSGNVLRLLLFSTLSSVAAGVLAGAVIGGWVAELYPKLLFGVVPIDAMTFSVVPLGVLGISVIAVAGPALQALRLDPAATLRCE